MKRQAPFFRRRPPVDPRPEFATCLVCGERLGVRLRDGSLRRRMPAHKTRQLVECPGSNLRIIPHKRKHGELMDLPVKTLKQRSGFVSSVITPIVTLAIAWLGALAANLDTGTTTGLVLGVLITGAASALTFLKKAIGTESVDARQIPFDLASVKKDGVIVNAFRDPPEAP